MGVCKWACLILCWIRGSSVALQSSCETVSDLKLCPIRVGEGNSQITACGKNVAEGSTAAWNREGWCGLSYNVLRVGKYRVRWKCPRTNLNLLWSVGNLKNLNRSEN